MISTSVHTRAPATAGRAVQLAKAATIRHARPGLVYVASHYPTSHRCFSTTPVAQLKDFFPAKDTPHIMTTPAAWPHHGYTMEEMKAVVPAHRKPNGFGDWAAWKIVRFARYWMDKATGMDRKQQVDKKNPTTSVVAEKPLTEAQWVSHPSSRPSRTRTNKHEYSLYGLFFSRVSPAFPAWSAACYDTSTVYDA